jgi:hypothetical protein
MFEWDLFLLLLLFRLCWMEQLVFLIVIDYRGRHSKGIEICNVTEVNLQQRHTHKWIKIILDTAKMFEMLTIFKITLTLFLKDSALLTFLELPSLNSFLYYIKTCCSNEKKWIGRGTYRAEQTTAGKGRAGQVFHFRLGCFAINEISAWCWQRTTFKLKARTLANFIAHLHASPISRLGYCILLKRKNNSIFKTCTSLIQNRKCKWTTSLTRLPCMKTRPRFCPAS